MVIVYIRWTDSAFWAGSVGEHELDGPCEIESAGILVSEDEESITITIALQARQDRDNYYGVLCIPLVSVLEVQRLPL